MHAKVEARSQLSTACVRHCTTTHWQQRTQKAQKNATADSDAAQQLHVAGFDAEQIWGQLDMHAGPLLKRIKRLIARAGDAAALLQPQAEAQLDGEQYPAVRLVWTHLADALQDGFRAQWWYVSIACRAAEWARQDCQWWQRQQQRRRGQPQAAGRRCTEY